jgi:hypothetical protein
MLLRIYKYLKHPSNTPSMFPCYVMMSKMKRRKKVQKSRKYRKRKHKSWHCVLLPNGVCLVGSFLFLIRRYSCQYIYTYIYSAWILMSLVKISSQQCWLNKDRPHRSCMSKNKHYWHDHVEVGRKGILQGFFISKLDIKHHQLRTKQIVENIMHQFCTLSYQN